MDGEDECVVVGCFGEVCDFVDYVGGEVWVGDVVIGGGDVIGCSGLVCYNGGCWEDCIGD